MGLGLFLNDNCEKVALEETSFYPGYAMMQMKEAGQTLREEARVKIKKEWKLEIRLSGRRRRMDTGINAYPPYWKGLKTLFRPFSKE